MRKASITYVKNNLSAVVKMVREGTPVLLTDYGKPVARLEPLSEQDLADAENHLNDLEKRGLIRRSRKPLPASFWKSAPVKTRDGSSVVEALLEERRSGR